MDIKAARERFRPGASPPPSALAAPAAAPAGPVQLCVSQLGVRASMREIAKLARGQTVEFVCRCGKPVLRGIRLRSGRWAHMRADGLRSISTAATNSQLTGMALTLEKSCIAEHSDEPRIKRCLQCLTPYYADDTCDCM